MIIGATTVGTGGDWSPTFRLGDKQCIGPSQLLRRSLDEISQKVLFHNSHMIVFGCKKQGRNHGRKVETLELI